MLNTVPYFIKEDLNIDKILVDSVRGKTSASNEPICNEEKAELLIAQIAQFAIDCSGIAIDCFDCNQLFPPWTILYPTAF